MLMHSRLLHEVCYVLWFQGRSKIGDIVGIIYGKPCCRSFASALQLRHLSFLNRTFNFLTQAFLNDQKVFVTNGQQPPRISPAWDDAYFYSHWWFNKPKIIVGGHKSTEKPKQKPSFAHHPCANVPWKDQRSSPSNASGCNRHDCKPQLNVDGKTNLYHLCSPKNCLKNSWIQSTYSIYLIHPILVARNNHHQSIFIL